MKKAPVRKAAPAKKTTVTRKTSTRPSKSSKSSSRERRRKAELAPPANPRKAALEEIQRDLGRSDGVATAQERLAKLIAEEE